MFKAVWSDLHCLPLKQQINCTNSKALVSEHFNLYPAEPGYTLPMQTVDPDQLASEEANWSGSALFAIKYLNL